MGRRGSGHMRQSNEIAAITNFTLFLCSLQERCNLIGRFHGLNECLSPMQDFPARRTPLTCCESVPIEVFFIFLYFVQALMILRASEVWDCMGLPQPRSP